MTTLRHDPIERDAPTAVEPPQGPYEVWALTDDGAARILTTDDEAHAQLTFRKQGHAVARGGVVLRFNVNLKPAQQRVLKHAVKHAPAPETAPETTPTPPAEEVPAAHEEPVKTTEETTKDCTNCGEHPAAPPKDTTPKGEEGWCMHCRRNASIRRNRDAKPASVSQPRKKATKKPARKIAKAVRKPKAPPSQSPVATLASAITSRLGGLSEDDVRRIAHEVVQEELRKLAEAIG
jgi:hypothetical protein